MKANRPGYTLLEVALVTSIIGVMAGFAMPSINTFYRGIPPRAAADTVKAALLQGRMHAMEEGRAYRFSITPGKGKFRVAPDDPGYWSGSGNGSGQGGEDLVLEQELPAGVQFALGNGGPGGGKSGEWETAIVFGPDGSTTDDIEITFEAEGTAPLVLSLRSLTGVATVRQKQPEDRRR
jgi:prepilin-type N-terminal cleavage/methylation domain-containing protein